MQERAGLEVKYLAYTSLNALKVSDISQETSCFNNFERSQNLLQPIQHQCFFAYLLSLLYDTALQQWNQLQD